MGFNFERNSRFNEERNKITLMFNILDEHRKELLPLFQQWKDEFYLAGGTGLALQIGHRKSIDFDFFSLAEFDASKIYSRLKTLFANVTTKILQEEKNTLTILANDTVKLSFFSYPYPLLFPTIEFETMQIASLEDIACMKLSAIVSRATNKDYVDLYFILQKISLYELLSLAKRKFTDLDENLILKSLVYFDDVAREPLQFLPEKNISFDSIIKYLEKVVSIYMFDKKRGK